MADRVHRRAFLALLGAILALGAVLFPVGASAPTGSADPVVAVHRATARPFPTTMARPTRPVAKAAHVAYRLIGFAAPTAGSPTAPVSLSTLVLGLLAAAGPSWRSRLGRCRCRPRGPPAPAAPAAA